MSDNTASVLMLIALFVFVSASIAEPKEDLPSLGRNKQFRMCVRMGHELRKEMAKLNKEAEKSQASQASSISQRLNEFLGRAREMFTPRRTTS
jgi:hypothetical protein